MPLYSLLKQLIKSGKKKYKGNVMYRYRLEINSGGMLEYKYYVSLRKRNKKNIGRRLNIKLTPEKQKTANKIRAIKNAQRLLVLNFKKGDWFIRFSAPYKKFTEKEFNRIIRNWMDRIKYHAKKKNLTFKYIGFIECGKRGQNWHLHIVLQECIREIAMKQWPYKDGINLKPLYQKGNFAALADYIHKDIEGKKRLMTSRNLEKPTYNPTLCSKKIFKKLENGEVIDNPKGFILAQGERLINDFTGSSYSFTFYNPDIFYAVNAFVNEHSG